MPEAVSFRVSTYWKLAREEAGLTTASSVRLTLAQALNWIMDELPDDAWTVTYEDTDEEPWEKVTLVIDWSLVPDSVRKPVLPARRR